MAPVLIANPDITNKRSIFFKFVLGLENSGYVAVMRLDRVNDEHEERFFHYPDELDPMLEWIDSYVTQYDLYFCPQLLDARKRTKEHVVICPNVWADLDFCPPEELYIEPTIVVESSPGRYQALWCLDEAAGPAVAEDISRRIAYTHRDAGADTSGWDLTQYLRIPYTYNMKYIVGNDRPVVAVKTTSSGNLTPETFYEVYPQVTGFEYADIDLPEPSEESADDILERHKFRLPPFVWHLYEKEPERDWSKALWQLEMLLFEGGLTREEVFYVTQEAACNKYKRDKKPLAYLWKEVCKAFFEYESRQSKVGVTGQHLDRPLLSDQERKDAEADISLADQYADWAKDIGDAAPVYHEAGAFILLSSILAGHVRLPTTFGTVTPNLWFMILADTTLTRKTTAMDLCMDLLGEVDQDAVLATDGSIEGLFTSLSMRPGRSSVFLRDEFSGLLEQMSKKDYYAGMAETFTKLYDGKLQKRVLRKETIEVRDPVLIVFAGGIKSRILQLLTYEQVASGFLPRFIFVMADSDITRLKPLGPPTDLSTGRRDALQRRIQTVSGHYSKQQIVRVGEKEVAMARQWEAELTPEAWLRYNKLETDMLQIGLDAMNQDTVTPTMDRLAKSGLKAAVLLAASRTLEERVLVEERDIVKAFSYIERWKHFSLEVVTNIGKSSLENQIQVIFGAIRRQPGLYKSDLARNYHLTSRDLAIIMSTLEERGMITKTKKGRTEALYATE